MLTMKVVDLTDDLDEAKSAFNVLVSTLRVNKFHPVVATGTLLAMIEIIKEEMGEEFAEAEAVARKVFSWRKGRLPSDDS